MEDSTAVTSGSHFTLGRIVAGPNGTIPVASGGIEVGKRVVLLKGREREDSNVSGGSLQQLTPLVRNITGSTSSKPSQRHETSGRIIRSIPSNNDACQNQSYLAGMQSERQTQAVNLERDKRPPRPPNPGLILKDHITTIATHPSGVDNDCKDEKAAANSLHGSVSVGDKNDKRMRNKDRPDRGVWTPRRSDGVHAGDDISLPAQQLSDSFDLSLCLNKKLGVKIGMMTWVFKVLVEGVVLILSLHMMLQVMETENLICLVQIEKQKVKVGVLIQQ